MTPSSLLLGKKSSASQKSLSKKRKHASEHASSSEDVLSRVKPISFFGASALPSLAKSKIASKKSSKRNQKENVTRSRQENKDEIKAAPSSSALLLGSANEPYRKKRRIEVDGLEHQKQSSQGEASFVQKEQRNPHLDGSDMGASFLNTPSAPRVSNPTPDALSSICSKFNSIHGCMKGDNCAKRHVIVLSQRKKALVRNLSNHLTKMVAKSVEQDSGAVAAGSSGTIAPVSFWTTQQDGATAEKAVANASLPRFSDAPFIDTNTKKAIKMLFKYKHMTLVQSKTITPSHIENYLDQDYMVKAKTGSGKTLSFLIPSLQILLDTRAELSGTIYEQEKMKQISVVVLSPTRELVIQTEKEAQKLLAFHPDIKCKSIIGGTKNIQSERSNFENHFIPDILIATPGRFHDHLMNTNGFPKHLKKLKVLIMDEADQLMDQGFKDSLLEIFQFLPSRLKRQTLMLSATIPPAVKSIARQALKPKYEFINCVDEQDVETNATLTQQYMPVTLSTMLPVLYTLLDHHIKSTPKYKVIVFLPTANQAEFFSLLFQSLKMQNYAMHSKKEQSYRRRISDLFRSESHLIMFSSDVSARGVDYPDVTLILQLGLPSSMDQYVHRIGRTARAGKCGTGIILLCQYETFFWEELRKKFKKEIQALSQLEIPLATKTALNKMVEKGLFSVNQKVSDAGSRAYVSFLGFYRQFARRLQWNNEQLVNAGNQYAKYCLGLEEPTIPQRAAVNLKLDGVRGLRIMEERTA